MKQGKIVAVIQARMGSTRLPGKVLKEIGGQPILGILIKRLRRSRRIDSILVATTEKTEDNGIVDLATKVGVEWYRGSEDDVLKRFIGASRAVKADIVIRVTADNPLTDPELMDSLIEAHLKNGADYTCCEGVILGTGVEVVNRVILEKIYPVARQAEYREHVTYYIYTHPELFKIHTVDFDLNCPHLRLTVDTEEDLDLMRKLYAGLGKLEGLTVKGIVEFLTAHPEIYEVNAGVKQKMPRVKA
jgi:spore coat polysaccharide biosynthesis protein SpsF